MPNRPPVYKPVPMRCVRTSPPRLSACRRGYGRTWQQVSKAYLAEHPLCADCMQRNEYTLATQVHHLVKHGGKAELLYERTNMLGLCQSCHSVRTARGE